MDKSFTSVQEDTYYIDATNVCYWQNTNSPSLKGLLKLLTALKKIKKASFFCIFDANLRQRLSEGEQSIYDKLLENKDFFHEVRGGKRVDDYLLGLADAYNAPIISNNGFLDARYGRYKWLREKELRKKRLFTGEVISTPHGSHLMLMDLDINTPLNESLDSLFSLCIKLLDPMEPYFRGKIKFFHERGWGRIVYQREEEVYFHKSFVKDPNAPLDTGQDVLFMMGQNERGPHAKDIEVWLTGTVVHYDEVKELGNILIDNTNRELFFFKSYFDEPYFQNLSIGQRITFVAGNNNKGDCARHIRLINDTSGTIEILKERINHLESLLRTKEDDINQLQEIIIQQEDEVDDYKQRLGIVDDDEYEYVEVSDTDEQYDESHEEEREDDLTDESTIESPSLNWEDEEEEFELEEEEEIIIQPIDEKAIAEDFDTPEKRLNWWHQLNDEWKKAFNVMSGNKEITSLLPDDDLQALFGVEKLSFYRTSKHKLSFKLHSIGGAKYLTNLISINVRGHKINQFDDVSKLQQLEQLNCSENGIQSLAGIDQLSRLEQLICMKNELTGASFKGITEKLPNLVRLDARKNPISETDKKYIESLGIENIAV